MYFSKTQKTKLKCSLKRGLTESFVKTLCLSLAIVYLGCDNSNGEDQGFLVGKGAALVITTDYTTGAYSAISLEDLSVAKDINFIHSDASCRFDAITKTPFIMLRLGADAVDVLNPDTLNIEKEYSVGPAMNPHDIAVIAKDRAYISRYESAEMLVVNPGTGEEIDTIDLSEYADDDGIPEVSGMYVDSGKVYALAQRVNHKSWEPTDKSYILVIDGLKGTIENAIELTGTNPDELPIYSQAMDRLVITEPGSFSNAEDGGIELFNIADNSLSGFIVEEKELGGNVLNGVIASKTKGYAIMDVAGDNGRNTNVVSFNPDTGKKLSTLLKGEGWVYVSIALSPDNSELWVADRTGTAPGIRIFNTADDLEKTKAPIDVGLPPIKICFVNQ